MSSLEAFSRHEILKGFSKLADSEKVEVLLGRAGPTVVSFDIEANHLSANVGRILCCSFKPLGEEPYTFHGLERRFKRADVSDDGPLAVAIRDELEKFDIIVGWNSKGFDVKYINARCMHAGERTKRKQYHVDGMWSFRTKARAWSGLKAVQQFLVPAGEEKTSITWEQWQRALGWNKELREAAMTEVVDHCRLDVIVLENVYRRLAEANAIRGIRLDGGIQ